MLPDMGLENLENLVALWLPENLVRLENLGRLGNLVAP